MSITSLDLAVAGMRPPEKILKVGGTMEAAGVLHSLFYATGRPGAAAAPSPGLAGAALTSYAGQIPFTNPVSGYSYLERLFAAATQPGTLYLLDRLWHNSGITITTTTGQTINSVAFPARDNDGAVSGRNVLAGIEVSAATGNGSPVTNTTITYTNSLAAGSKTGTIASFPATAAAGTFVPFELAAGDVGIQSIQTLTLGTSYVSGTIHLVAYRELASLALPTANVGALLDMIGCGFPRLFDNTTPFLLWLPTGTTAVTVHADMVVSQG
jgi:hypothetical protein